MAELDRYSPYRYSYELEDEDGNMYTTEMEPYEYENLPDNIPHKCIDGDTWYNIAGKYWSTLPDSGALGRLIADFQPEPVVDPYIKLKPGQIVIVPSLNTLQTRIFNPDRQQRGI